MADVRHTRSVRTYLEASDVVVVGPTCVTENAMVSSLVSLSL